MKMIKHLLPVSCTLLIGGVMTTSCNDEWDNHYDASSLLSSQSVAVYAGSTSAYIQSQSDLSKMSDLFEQTGMFDKIEDTEYWTAIVCTNDDAADAFSNNDTTFAKNCLADFLITPNQLTDGFGIYTQSGKNIWVNINSNGHIQLDNYNLTKIVKTDNGYIYYVDGVIPIHQNIYEYIMGLGSDYSLLQQYIRLFEERYFDENSSTPNGVDAMGNTTYSDSVISTRNTLMDRYTSEGLEAWDMRSENYQSTVFLPNNELIENAYRSALDSIPSWLNRAPTASDSLKFKKWIVASCFVNDRLSPSEVAVGADNFDCVGGYIQEIDKALDKETYTEYDAAHWNPSIQTVDITNPIELSNGTIYKLTSYKIPNHIVIWRVKSRFYQIWAAMTNAQKEKYFTWNHWTAPLVVNDAQGCFELTSTLPTIYYHVLTAIPDEKAIADSLPCSVVYEGLLYNSDDKKYALHEVSLPAGEYYLRMGFKHSLTYSISIYFAGIDEEFGEPLIKDMSLIATGSNFHFDRGGAMEGLDFFGSESIGYPEGYDWRYWYEQDPNLYIKASAYDTDGYQVAVVNIPKNGNFKIKIESNDDAELYDPTNNRTKSNVTQLMMYHWCLRPTSNNY